MMVTTSLRRRTALVLGLMALAPLELRPALAYTQNNLVDLRVINRDTGEVLRTWHRDGRLYVAGDPGTRYGLRFTNHTGRRVLAVVSVDGVNIITVQKLLGHSNIETTMIYLHICTPPDKLPQSPLDKVFALCSRRGK